MYFPSLMEDFIPMTLTQIYHIMSRKEEILNDNVYIVGGKLNKNVDAPNGIVNHTEVEALQEEFLNFSLQHLASTLINVKKEYPKKDTVDITVSTDLIIMRREDFDELMILLHDVIKEEI